MLDQLISDGALFFVNDSGGKDSQAMKIFLSKVVPVAQLVVIHADLPGVEWEGCEDHARQTSEALGLPFHTTRAKKTFFDMVDARGMFPSPSYRQCTSDLKRDPIEKFIRNYMAAAGKTVAVNCVGIRGQESSARSKAKAWKTDKRLTTRARTVYSWLPIFDWSVTEVWAEIASAGQVRHYAYDLGMSRLSCCFCIMSSTRDLQIAAKHNPAMYQQYVATEARLGVTMLMPGKDGVKVWLRDVVEGKAAVASVGSCTAA